MTTGLRPGSVGQAGGHELPERSPAMRAYCSALARFTSAVQSTELALRNDVAGTRDDHEQRELSSASRLRSAERAHAAAEEGLEHTATARRDHGLAETASRLGAAGIGRARRLRLGAADLGMALTALSRRRDELRLAETEFGRWLGAEDELSWRMVVGAGVVVGALGAAAMATAGTAMSAASSLMLLAGCVLAVVVAVLAVAISRRLPHACAGPSLARVPTAASLAGLGLRAAGLAAVGLAAVNIVAGLL